jgi:hypothetical protein
MAKIVLGIGTSHTPLLTFSAPQWAEYAKRDLTSTELNTSDGRWLNYAQLEKEVSGRFAPVATYEQYLAKDAACQRALDRLSADLAAADPDVVVIITDDQNELFTRSNTPAVSIYYGEQIDTHPRDMPPNPQQFHHEMAKAYAMDKVRRFAGEPKLARELIERLIEKGVDIGAAAAVDDPVKAGFGHGVGFVVMRLFGGRQIPVVPVLLNTYYPPNVPTAARCYDIGKAIGQAIRESPADRKVVVIASGGLSHFVVDEELDRRILAGMCDNKPELLRTLTPGALNSGSSEIRNWIAVAGAIEGMKNRWVEYQPLYRSPAGTGIGVAFGAWA